MIRHVVSALRWRDLLQAVADEALARVVGRPRGVQRLHAALATALGQPADALWVTGSGRAALHALVGATRRCPGDHALLPGFTCVVVPHVFSHLGIPVRYVDLPLRGLNPEPRAWEAAIDESTRWVIVPHNFGVPTGGVAELRARFPHVIFVEDVAHGWGAPGADGRLLGSAGHAAFFSFEYSKCLTTGLGGALLVNDPALRPAVGALASKAHRPLFGERARVWLTLAYHLSQATWPSFLAGALTSGLRSIAGARGLAAETPSDELSGESAPDYARALPDSLARLALPQLRRMAEVLARRRAQAAVYAEALRGSPWVIDLATDAPAATALLRYPVAVRDPADRPRLREGLRALGIEPGEWFNDVVHPAGSRGHGYVTGMCPNGDRLAECIVNLPLGLHAGLCARQRLGFARLVAQGPDDAGAAPGAAV